MPDPVGQGAPAGGLSPDSSVSLSSPTTGTGTAAASRRAKVKAAPTETNTHKGEQLQKLHANLFLSSVETQLSFRGKQHFESDLTHLDEGGRQHPRRSCPDCHDPEVWDPVNVHGSPLLYYDTRTEKEDSQNMNSSTLRSQNCWGLNWRMENLRPPSIVFSSMRSSNLQCTLPYIRVWRKENKRERNKIIVDSLEFYTFEL
ncbi:hypothetical protein EJB05_26386, partial [Eragrostis curvula]